MEKDFPESMFFFESLRIVFDFHVISMVFRQIIESLRKFQKFFDWGKKKA